ncbi:YqzE family protein [Cytobacillus oceanisediminis]|uniref:YqzE family protein n=1 Tax=Cytobacillus oceanisediminis TaxID=665099 RepID=UPI00373672EA
MKSNEYVKYITQTVVKYIDQPKDERKKHRMEKKDMKEPFLFRWFGVLPYIFYFGIKKKKHK